MDQTEEEVTAASAANDTDLIGWVMEKVTRWRQHRDKNYKSDWDRYWSIWTGQWDHNVRVKSSERSRIIAPASQNAVDQTVSEMVEATFGRGKWFDVGDTDNDQVMAQEIMLRDNLLEDFHRDRVVSAVTEVYYNGSIFGTGIAKRIIEQGAVNRVYWEAIRPYNFVIDTAATTVDSALGCAHETIRPLHEIQGKQNTGEYRDSEIGSGAMPEQYRGQSSSTFDLLDGFSGDESADPEDGVYITEYHGKVPAEYLHAASTAKTSPADEELLADGVAPGDDSGQAYVEAIIVIGNGGVLLKAVPNPIKDDAGTPDRGFISYQHHKCPGSFWGIGQVQKAFNSQMGLDGELRARSDTLGLVTYPMVGADATRLPKNLKLEVAPGKLLLTNGRPSEIIESLKIGNLDPISFQQSSEYERMVQMATGANDPAKQINPASQNMTATGASIQSTGFIKRAKLTMQNVDTDFLDPLVKKSLYAYTVVSPNRYPKMADFQVNSTMSIMAREFEQAQMTNLLAIVPHDSPAFLPVLRGIVENYSGPSKDKILEAVDKLAQPDPQQQQMQQQQAGLAMQKMYKEVEFLQAQIDEMKSRTGLTQAKITTETAKPAHDQAELAIQAAQLHDKRVNTHLASQNIDHAHRQQLIDLHTARLKAAQPAPGTGANGPQ